MFDELNPRNFRFIAAAFIIDCFILNLLFGDDRYQFFHLAAQFF